DLLAEAADATPARHRHLGRSAGTIAMPVGIFATAARPGLIPLCHGADERTFKRSPPAAAPPIDEIKPFDRMVCIHFPKRPMCFSGSVCLRIGVQTQCRGRIFVMMV